MNTLIIGGVSASVIIIGLVEVAKRSGMPVKWSPLLSLCLGIVVTVAYGLLNQVTGPAWLDLVGLGVLAGLSACGIYSGTKATLRR